MGIGLSCKTENLAEKIQFQQQAVAELKREIFGKDKKARSKYIREFVAEFNDFQSVSSYEELLEVARHVRVIYVGDYHALAQSQQFQAQLLSDLSDEKLVLGLELFYGHNQRALDDWMSYSITDDQLLRRCHFELEWGYHWQNYRPILDVARQRNIPVFGLDCSPRDNFRLISKRDTAVARRIVELLSKYPDHTVVVSFGESHLASNHLPAKVAAASGPSEPSRLTILQNVDEIYWRISCDGLENVPVVKLRHKTYCVFNATPFEKYEGYRRQLEVWDSQDQDDGIDLTSTVYGLISTILDFIGVDRYGHCLEREGVCVEYLIDAYPEVYCSEEFEDFQRLLQHSGLAELQRKEIISHTVRQGSCYVPGVNAIFIGKFDLMHAAEEAAHFVNFALKRQRYGRYRPMPLDVAGEFYLSALEEALGYFGSKLIDPRRDQTSDSLVLNWPSTAPEVRQTLGLSVRQLRWMKEFILAHKSMEHNYRRLKSLPRIISHGLRSKGSVFTVLTHELGYLLGEQLYRGYIDGVVSRREISQLFKTRFEEHASSFEAYLGWAERLKAVRLLPAAKTPFP